MGVVDFRRERRFRRGQRDGLARRPFRARPPGWRESGDVGRIARVGCVVRIGRVGVSRRREVDAAACVGRCRSRVVRQRSSRRVGCKVSFRGLKLVCTVSDSPQDSVFKVSIQPPNLGCEMLIRPPECGLHSVAGGLGTRLYSVVAGGGTIIAAGRSQNTGMVWDCDAPSPCHGMVLN